MLQRHQRRVCEQAAELTELRDPRIGDVESLIDFGRALEKLTTTQQKVAVLVMALEYTPAEAARLLELNESTTRSHLRRARIEMRKRHLIDGPEKQNETEEDSQ